jgi:hypothetical protein
MFSLHMFTAHIVATIYGTGTYVMTYLAQPMFTQFSQLHTVSHLLLSDYSVRILNMIKVTIQTLKTLVLQSLYMSTYTA